MVIYPTTWPHYNTLNHSFVGPMAGVKRWNSHNGPIRYRGQEQCGTATKICPTDRWGVENRWSEEESQTLTQQSSQRTQPSSSVPVNHFENILATQRHSEVTSHLKLASKTTSEAQSSQFAAITECLEQLHHISKSVAGFSADARRLERSNREQFDSLERKISGVEEKICVILKMVREKECAPTESKEFFSASLSSNVSSIQVMDSFQDDGDDDGVGVAEYLQGLQRKRSSDKFKHPGSICSRTISSQSSSRRDCPKLLMLGSSDGYDDLFEEEASTVSTDRVTVQEYKYPKEHPKRKSPIEPSEYEIARRERSVSSSRRTGREDDIDSQSESQSSNINVRYHAGGAITPISSPYDRMGKPIRWGGGPSSNMLQSANKRARQEYRRVE